MYENRIMKPIKTCFKREKGDIMRGSKFDQRTYACMEKYQ
jgi:hypothetical protein